MERGEGVGGGGEGEREEGGGGGEGVEREEREKGGEGGLRRGRGEGELCSKFNCVPILTPQSRKGELT